MLRLQEVATFPSSTPYGDYEVRSYQRGGSLAFALTRGELPRDGLLVRVQSACMLSESFLVDFCDCGDQLRRALQIGGQETAFLLVYLPDQEGRGLGLHQKLRAVEVERRQRMDTVEAFETLGLPLDLRDYRDAATLIRTLNRDRPIRLMTNNPTKLREIQEQGVAVQERVALFVPPANEDCLRYLRAKKRKMGHLLPQID